MSFGSIVGAGTLGSALATAPALLRLEGAAGVCSPFGAWALLIAGTVLPMSLLVFALRRARAGFVALGLGKDRVPLAMLFAWFGSTFAALALLGALLRAVTHHHALAGVTFAIVGLALSLVLALVWTRLAALTRLIPKGGQWVVMVALGVGMAGVLAWSLHELTHGSPSPLSNLQNVKLVDGLAFAGGALLVSGRLFTNRRGLALLGPPLAAMVLVLGVSSLRACPSLRDALPGQAPGVSWVVGLIGLN
jgi:hypothetical protein